MSAHRRSLSLEQPPPLIPPPLAPGDGFGRGGGSPLASTSTSSGSIHKYQHTSSPQRPRTRTAGASSSPSGNNTSSSPFFSSSTATDSAGGSSQQPQFVRMGGVGGHSDSSELSREEEDRRHAAGAERLMALLREDSRREEPVAASGKQRRRGKTVASSSSGPGGAGGSSSDYIGVSAKDEKKKRFFSFGSSDSSKKDKKNQVGVFFEVPLETSMRYCRENNLPHLADHLLGFLKRDHTATEGLFRVSPSGVNVMALKKQFDTGKLVDVSEVCPHDAGGVLKLYYRQLPDPVIPKSFYQDAMAPTRCKHVLSEEEYLLQLRAVFDRLKRDRPDHWYLLQRLIDLLHCCAENCEVNKMTRKNLAVVQAPDIIRLPDEDDVQSLLRDTPIMNEMVEDLIKFYPPIFRGHDTTESYITLEDAKSRVYPGTRNKSLVPPPAASYTHSAPAHGAFRLPSLSSAAPTTASTAVYSAPPHGGHATSHVHDSHDAPPPLPVRDDESAAPNYPELTPESSILLSPRPPPLSATLQSKEPIVAPPPLDPSTLPPPIM